MTESGQKLLEEALKLTDRERAELAAGLLASLDGPADPDAEVAWAKEIERRARESLADDWKGRPGEEVCDAIRRELRG